MKLALTEVLGTRRISINIDSVAKMYNLKTPVSATIVYENDEEFLDSLDEQMPLD